MRSSTRWTMLILVLWSGAVFADGKLLATGGVSSVEGGAGGGIVPWAVTAGYGSDDEWGGTAFVAHVDSGDYQLGSIGAAVSWKDRIEFSLARHTLEMPTLVANLGLPAGSELNQTVYGLKARILGDVVYGQWPQVAVGLQHKVNTRFGIPGLVGARRDSDTGLYVAASKLWLDAVAGRHLFVNATVRRTRANQLGLLGFGGDLNDDHELMLEMSAAVFLDRQTAVGVEYRQKPNNLRFAVEDDWRDFFIAYFPTKRISIAAAYADLGSIATIGRQNGFYVSLQGSF